MDPIEVLPFFGLCEEKRNSNGQKMANWTSNHWQPLAQHCSSSLLPSSTGKRSHYTQRNKTRAPFRPGFFQGLWKRILYRKTNNLPCTAMETKPDHYEYISLGQQFCANLPPALGMGSICQLLSFPSPGKLPMSRTRKAVRPLVKVSSRIWVSHVSWFS